MRWFLLAAVLLVWHPQYAQTTTPVDSSQVPNSANGWYLSPRGTIRILVIFAEVDYDKHPDKDPQPNATERWPKGQLPVWKDQLFDPFPTQNPAGEVTRYYRDMSLGQFTVLGDYIDRLVVIRESEQTSLRDWSGMAWEGANKFGQLHTAHGLSITDFDLWQEGGKPGLPKINKPDNPHSYDHVMVILRNSSLTHGQGSTDAGSAGLLYGHPSDTQSRFGAMNGLPFEILKHEFNHLLLGSNNFHSGGGNAPIFTGYFMAVQGGWSLMGAANSSLLTCSGWDRDRLGWLPEGSRFRMQAHDARGNAVNGNLNPLAGDTGIYVLRDFITSGDALRIHMPFLPDDVYPQWLWLENHQGEARNGCPKDKFHYQEMSCVTPAVPGIYAQMQVAKEQRSGADIYGGFADYLRPVLANGNYDRQLRGDTITFQCLWPGPTQPFLVKHSWANPLSGWQDQEFPLFDLDGNGKLTRKEAITPRVEIFDGKTVDEGQYLGSSRHAFTVQGNHLIGMGTNPSSANMLTLACNMTSEQNRGKAPDVRTVYLNGISVELLEQREDGSIVVHVRSGDTRIANDVRWCADSIVLPPLHGYNGTALTLAKGSSLRLDRSGTPTRMAQQGKDGAGYWFSPATKFTVARDARVVLERRSKLQLVNNSVLHVMPNAKVQLEPRAKLSVEAGSRIVLHGNAMLSAKSSILKKLRRKGQLSSLPE
ncbi:MAG: hypothetical protein JST38_17810 [Bacteroidetes bacterium]|nr:hypothetical protein [Bacteroidota bacterium]MBS1942726.1 hypothetical protein [Bacteroidota bacterium]